jgi:NADH dehydrogenase
MLPAPVTGSRQVAGSSARARPRVIVVGGGFAGVACARTLRRSKLALDIVLFSRDNHMVFQPLLPDVAGSSLNPRAVAPPLRQLLPGVQCRTEEVHAVDFATSELVHEGHDGQPRRMHYDHLVLACGNAVNLNLLPGMANHALPLKTIGDAIALRARIMQQLERADLADTVAERRYYLNFIVVGGGFSGVEVAGEINDLIRAARRQYPGIGHDEAFVTLLHGMPQLLPEISPGLREFARRRMQRRGIRVVCDARVVEVTARGARLADGSKVEGATVVCTVGTTACALVAGIEAPKDRGRLKVDPDMRLPGRSDAWAIGDCALVPNAFDDRPAPPTAQFAEREGRQCAHNILAVLGARPTAAFNYRPAGAACGIGGREGVAELFGLKFSGFVAWWLWRSAFLAKIPSFAQKVKVGIDWAWELLAARDLSHFRPTQSSPLARAHYAPGETLLRGDAAIRQIHSLEAGEVEIVRHRADGGEDLLATLSAGAVIGAATLAAFMDPLLEVRARTAVDAWVLGDDALSRLSQALAPVEALIARAVTLPGRSIWRHHMRAMDALAQRSTGSLEAAQQMLVLTADDSLGAAFHALIQQRAACVVVTQAQRLVGVATRTDLLDALSRGATRDTPLREAMNARPVSISAEQPASLAAELMAERSLKYLPVVDAAQRPLRLLAADDFVRIALSMPR